MAIRLGQTPSGCTKPSVLECFSLMDPMVLRGISWGIWELDRSPGQPDKQELEMGVVRSLGCL